MRRPFTTNEVEVEGMKIIEDCARNKLRLNNSNLPFGWMKRSRCDLQDETDILGTWRTNNADCLPMWYNLRDRLEFYETCLKSYDIENFRQKGFNASEKLQNLAFELHKLEKQNSNNKLTGKSSVIASGIMSGMGVLLAPSYYGGVSLASIPFDKTYSAFSLSGTIESDESLFGENPLKKVSDAVKEMKELRDDGNSIAALLVLYMVSHDDLQRFVHSSQYRRLITKFERDIHTKLQLWSSENLFTGVQALSLARISSKIIPAATFSASVKSFCQGQINKITKPISKLFRSAVPITISNMKLVTPPSKFFLPKLFRKSKAVLYLKKIPGFPALASAFSDGLGIWEVFEGKTELRKGMVHHVKLASRRTLLMTDEIVEAYMHIFGDDFEHSYDSLTNMKKEEIGKINLHVAEGNWDSGSGMHLRFESDGRQCISSSKFGLSKGWIKYKTKTELGTCYLFPFMNDDLTVSITSMQSSVNRDEIVIDVVEVVTGQNLFPTFQTSMTSSIRISAASTGKLYRLYPIRNRIVGIKTHTSTTSSSGTDSNIMCRIRHTFSDGDDGINESVMSSVIRLDTSENNFENDKVDIFSSDLLESGFSAFLNNHPIDNMETGISDGNLEISLKSTGSEPGNGWNVDLIKLYYIGTKGQQLVFVCHTGEKWIRPSNNYIHTSQSGDHIDIYSNNKWYDFPCELYRPANPAISIEKFELSVCDTSSAGSSSNRIQIKLCQNARYFSSDQFENAVNAGRCCETNYFSGSYTRGETTGIDGNTYYDDGGEKLGQCEGFEMTKGSFEMLVENEKSDAVCFDKIEFYGNDENGLTSSSYPIPFRTCSLPTVWAESSQNKIDDYYHECSNYYNFADLRSRLKCHLNSKIKFTRLRIGLCNRNYAASSNPFRISICDQSQENCCTTNDLNTDDLFNSYGNMEDGSYIKDIDTLKLGNCKDQLLSATITIFVNVQGSDGMCVDYFQFGENLQGYLNSRTSTTVQHAEIYAESNKVKICPRDISYEKAPIHCEGLAGNKLQKIAMKVMDKVNAGSSDDIKFIVRNSDGNMCETINLRAADFGNYREYTNFGLECKKLEISDYVHLWVATVHHNDNLFLTHLYLDVADENGVSRQMACLLDQNEEFFINVHGNQEQFGVPLKCM